MTIYKIQLFAYGNKITILLVILRFPFLKKYTEDTPIFQLKKGISVLEKDGGTTNFDNKFHARNSEESRTII